MKREIKFKGKRIDNGEWIYGFFVKDQINRCRIYLQPFNEATSNTYYFVKSKTMSQYTGLKDKNGKEIYEGDIVKVLKSDNVLETHVAKIVFSTRRAAFMISADHVRIPVCNIIPSSLGITDPDINIVVIGNIYENPELLKQS